MELEKDNKTSSQNTTVKSVHTWMERSGLDETTLCGAIETIIFMSEKPISLSKIKNLIDHEIPDETLQMAINRLKEEYQQNHHGIFIREVAEGHQFATRQNHAKFVKNLYKASTLVLTPSALEVLAIIAYRQPISRVEIDKIRSVDSSHLVRGLMDKKLIRISGRSEEAGRPVLFSTTNEFLETFSLKNLSDLPPERELIDLAKDDIGEVGDIKEIVTTSEKKEFTLNEIEEIDKLKGQIKSIKVNTEFTKELHREENKRKVKTTSEHQEEGVDVPKPQPRSAFDIMEDHLKKNEQKSLPKESSTKLDNLGNKEMGELDKKEQHIEKLQDEIENEAQNLQMNLRFNKEKPEQD